MNRTLDQLLNGQHCTIVDCVGNDVTAIRLMEMGLVPGERVERTGQAPLGDPLEFLVNGTRLSLRKNEAQRITVQLLDS
jgi:ferrous iron transport protein A